MAKYKTIGDRRLALLLLFLFMAVAIVVMRLFYMQVLKHGSYIALAQEGRQGYRELEARRGEIYIKDFHSNDHFRLATNVTLDTIFADPILLNEPKFVADKLAPLLFNEEEELEFEEARLEAQRLELDPELTEEEVDAILKPRSLDELKAEFEQDLLKRLSQKVREEILLLQEPSVPVRKAIRKLGLEGVEVDDRAIYAYPARIVDKEEYAVKLSEIMEIPVERMQAILEGKNRYVVLQKKVRPETSDIINKLKKEYEEEFKGIAFEEHTYRYYPELELGAQVLGFMNSEREGVYGLEAAYDEELRGKAGVFKAQLDGAGRQLTVGKDVVIESAQDGADVYLTLDRSIQRKVEQLLERAVVNNRADTGEAIVMDPKTGQILAMAHYPTFDPNEYWKALETEPIVIDDEQKDNIIKKNYGGYDETYLVLDEITDEKVRLFPIESDKTGETYYEKYENNVGALVYKNRTVTDIYEPGSVFKAITMAIGLDAAGITPDEMVDDIGPIKVDEFTIDNALGEHFGRISMTRVLETSNNIGMAFVARRLGSNLFYSYMKKFGLGRTTDIEFLGESSGRVEKFTKWSESELVTHAFGQGISLTPIQMITAFGALANDGVLMEPYVIEKIVQGEDVNIREPRAVHQVISKETVEKITAMLVSVIDNGQLRKTVKTPGYKIAGKTGTSQTYRNGKPLEGAGTTITSFAGFAPAEDPKFVVLVKIDRPRTSQWATAVAAPLYREISDYLLEYFAIPPTNN